MNYRLLVCSYKRWYDPEFFGEQMKRLHALHGEITLVHRGGPWGAELLAHDWASRDGFSEDVFEKDVHKFGYDADRELNESMIQSGVDEIYVFINSRKSRTRPVCRIEPDIMVLSELFHIPVVKFELSRRKDGNGRQYKRGGLGGRSSEKPVPRSRGGPGTGWYKPHYDSSSDDPLGGG